MIPTIYDKTGNTKYGELVDCIKGIVIEVRNGLFQAEVQYCLFSPHWDKLIRGNIIIADANDILKNQKFRINKVSKPINGQFTVKAKHISYDMARDIIEGLEIESQSCEYCLNQIFRSSQFSQHFKGHSDIINSQNFKIKETNPFNAIAGTEGSIIDTFGTGAELLRDNTDIYVLNKRGHDNGVTIEYGKNLTGITLDEDDSSMITRIKGYAKYSDENGEEVIVYTTPKYIDSPRVLDYETPFVEAIDFSNNFEDDEIPTSEKLKELVENYFTDTKCDLPKTNAKISFIPLSKCVGYEDIEDKISLCDTVTIKDYRYNYETKAKVIKTTYNFLTDRYESMEVGEPRSSLGDIIGENTTVKGEKGDKGDKGDPGADGNIGDFPDSLPTTPILTSILYGFASIGLDWTFENKIYYSYELYASKSKDFTPNVFDLIFEGQASTFLFQAKPNETWYFRVCALNTHGKRTEFSNQIAVTTTKVSDLSNYVESAAIGDALIGILSLDRGWVGELRGNYIDAKQLSVTDGNGKRTFDIDSFGNVNLDVTSLKINSKNVSTTEEAQNFANNAKDEAIKEASSSIEQTAKSIKNEVSEKYTTKQDFDNNNNSMDNKFATKSEMEQTATDVTFRFSQSGGMNLIKDGQFKSWDWNNGKWWWFDSNLAIYGRGSNGVNGTSVGIYSTNDKETRLYSNYLSFKSNTTYTFRADVFKEENVYWWGAYIEFKNANGDIIGQHDCPTYGYTFTTPEGCTNGYLVIKHGGRSSSSGGFVLWIDNVAIYEGTTLLPYSPHPDEVYDGNTTINGQGVTINNGALKVVNSNSEVVIDGQYNIHKIIATGLLDCNMPSGIQSREFYIDHNFGYIPHFAMEQQLNWDGKSVPLPAFTMGGVAANNDTLSFNMIIRCWATTTRLYVNIMRSPVRAAKEDNIKVRYFLYKEVAF